MPLLNRDASCAASCAVVSLFFHATVWPTRMVVGFGEKDCADRLPTIVIVTSAAATVGADGLELPQAVATNASTAASPVSPTLERDTNISDLRNNSTCPFGKWC